MAPLPYFTTFLAVAKHARGIRNLNTRAAILRTVLLLFSLCGAIAASTPPLYWEQSISQALSTRDSFYEKLGFSHHRQPLLSIVTEHDSAELAEKIQGYMTPDSPWPHLIAGLNLMYSAPRQADTHFTRALATCQNDPGLTWVLFSEFDQVSQSHWARTALRQLQRIFLARGAHRAPVIAQQLLINARKSAREGGEDASLDFWRWSERFEKQHFWPRIGYAQTRIFSAPLQAAAAFGRAIANLTARWDIQLGGLYQFYLLLRRAAAFFICATLLALAIRWLPAALHPVADMLPPAVAPGLRHSLVIAAYCACAFLGIAPFLLATVLLLWPLLHGRERIAGIVCGIALAALPLDARIREGFLESLSPSGALGMYRHAFDSGYTPELEQAVAANLKANRNDYLNYVSAALVASKKGAYQSAIRFIALAEQFEPDDPVVLMTAGNIHFLSGNLEKAGAYFKRCNQRYPRMAAASYNLSQYYLASMQTVAGAERVQDAASLDRALVDRFIETNDQLFAHTWPPLRQVLFQDYPPLHFWLRVWPRHSSTWSAANTLWAPVFWGVPLGVCAVAGPLLVAVFFMAGARRGRKPPRIFFCRHCGMPMCRRCRTSRACSACRGKLAYFSGIDQEADAQREIAHRTRLIARTRTAGLDILYPGCGSLSSLAANRQKALYATLATSFVYAAWVTLFTARFSYPFWIMRGLFWIVALPLAAYSIVFGLRASIRYWRWLSAKGRTDGA
jgi:tetratricopeptide (TPR) repeat protein